MILLQYWWVIESVVIIAIFAFIILLIVRSVKRQKLRQRVVPKTIGGRISFTLLYVVRVLGVALGTFLAVAVGVIIERVTITTITDTLPAPSEVTIPPDLPFDVQEVKFEGGDGLRMAGWFIPSQNDVTIILLHGYSGNRTGMLWHAKQLIDAGYGVLMYDERASGESDGTRRSYGWEDPRDVKGAIRFIETGSGNDSERIGIAGCSIGGQIALQSAAYFPELGAIWADGPSSVTARDLPAPKDPILALILLGNYSLDWAFELRLGMDAPEPIVEIIDDIAPRPIMLVSGGVPHPLLGSEAERMIPFIRHAGVNAQTWTIPEAVHCDGPNHRPDEYAQRMVEFFDTAFGITR